MSEKNAKRPILVWVVFLYYLVTIVPGAGGLLVVWRAASYSAQARAAIDSITTLGWILLGLTMALKLGGAIALLRLRCIAFPLFAGGIGLTILQLTMHHRNYSFSGADSHGPYNAAFGLAIQLVVCAYVWRLRSRSVLT
jgi:hypothetical protein